MEENQGVFESLSGGRVYVCFVCGNPFELYSQYCIHIKETHEEGREYVKCPLSRCQAPCRDLRLHFKVKHPSEAIPKTGQMKAMIWTDQKSPKRNRKKVNFKEGYIVSQKNGGKSMHYRSSWEHDVYQCLENLDEVSSYNVEHFPIEYYWKGRTKRYFPDLFITFKDGRHEIWEIKPDNQKSLDMNKAKWMACESHCEKRNWTFKVISESEIKQLKNQVKINISFKLQENEE